MVIVRYGDVDKSYYRALLSPDDLNFWPGFMHGLKAWRSVYVYEGLDEDCFMLLSYSFPDSDTYQRAAKRLYMLNVFHSVRGLVEGGA